MNDKAQRVKDFLASKVGEDVIGLLDEMARSPKDELFEMMTRKPESLTGRIAIAKANRAKALIEFKEELYALAGPLNPKGQGK